MTLKPVTGAQTNDFNLPVSDVSLRDTTTEETQNRLRIVPFTQNGQSDANLLAGYNRTKIEQKFQQDNSVRAGDDINGITTETAFQTPVSKGETQETVMRRAFEAMADRAGLSPESKKAFVESRMKANTGSDGKVFIINPDKKPPSAYTEDEWAQMSGINFYPVEADIKELKQLKSGDNFNAGTQAADEIIRALELGNRGILDKLTSDTDASDELAKALNKVKQNGANYDFQQGLLSRLGADKTVKLEEMLSDNPRYNSVIREALSTTGIQNPERQDRTADIRREIAEKSSLDALVRLTGDGAYPMDKNFLVGAGKRVMTKDVGWATRAGGGGMEMPVKTNVYFEGTQQLMRTIARNPEASLELLQDAEFVKNATILENSDRNEDTISQIIRSGMSKGMQEKEPEKVDNAIRVIAEIIKEPGNIRGTSRSGLRESENTVTEKMANAMVDMFINNPSYFVEAAGRERTDGAFDGEEFRKFVGTIRPYKGAMERLTAAVAIEYNKLLSRAENGNSSNVTGAGNLSGAFVDALIRENSSDAKEADEQREMLGKAIGIVAEVGSFYGLQELGVAEIPADLLGKVMNEVGQGSIKGSYADRASAENDIIYERQQATNAVAVVTTFERAANERLNAPNSSTVERRQAREFVQALQTYNDSLPAGEKILDQNGRLVNWRTATPQQRIRIADIFSKSTNGGQNPTPLDKAVNLLNNRMKPTFSELRDATSTQIRRQ